jgi:transcriptional regulator with XRE-family HTH domain
MEIREVFARNLRAARRAKGLSQEELAHRAEIDRTYISSLERSVYNASIDVVDRLATVLGVEASDLLKRPAGQSKQKSENSEISDHSAWMWVFTLQRKRLSFSGYKCDSQHRRRRAGGLRRRVFGLPPQNGISSWSPGSSPSFSVCLARLKKSTVSAMTSQP